MLTPADLASVAPKLLASIGDHFPQQAAAVYADTKWTLIGAASRTGKTFGAGRHFVRKILKDYLKLPWGEAREYWCVAPIHDDGRAQKIELLEIIPEWMIDRKLQGSKGEFFDLSHGRGILFLVGGASIHMKSADRPERLVAFKVRGVWWTEIARSKFAAWPNIYSRLSNYTDSWFIADTSPMGRCWFYLDVLKPARSGEKFKDSSVHEWKAVDSPYIAPEVIDAARVDLTPEMFRREFEASWEAFMGQIYKIWNHATHMTNACPFTPSRVVIACDQNMGSRVDTAMATFMVGGEHRDKHGRRRIRAHLEREFYQPLGLDYERYADAILEEFLHWHDKGFAVKVVVDPAMLRDFKNMLRTKGVVPYNAVNAINPGIASLGGAMNVREDGYPLLTVSRSCQHFESEIEGYAWAVSSSGVVSDRPDPASVCHLLDCARYAGMEIWSGIGETYQLR